METCGGKKNLRWVYYGIRKSFGIIMLVILGSVKQSNFGILFIVSFVSETFEILYSHYSDFSKLERMTLFTGSPRTESEDSFIKVLLRFRIRNTEYRDR